MNSAMGDAIQPSGGFVFVSYSHGEDRAYVERLAAFLHERGIAVWFDEELVTGARWTRTIRERIEKCGAFVVVMTPAADASDWVDREVGEALSLNKPILPLLLAGIRFFSLNNIQYEDVSGGRMPSNGFVTRLHGVVSTASTTAAGAERSVTADPVVPVPPTPPQADPVHPGRAVSAADLATTGTNAGEAVVRPPRAAAPPGPPRSTPRRPRPWMLAAFLVLAVLAGVGTYLLVRQRTDGAALPSTTTTLPSTGPSPSGSATLRTAPVPLATVGVESVVTFGFTVDGSVLATTEGGRVQLWDVTDPARPARSGTIPSPEIVSADIEAVAFNRDGTILALGRRDEKLELWNVEDPARPRRIATMDPISASARFSPDGHLMATAGLDGAAQLWNIDDPVRPRLLGTIKLNIVDIFSATFHPNGHLLAVSSFQRPVALWDISRPARPVQVATFQRDNADITGGAFSPTGTMVVTAGGHTATLWSITNPARPTRLATIQTPGAADIISFDLSKGGRALAVGLRTGKAYLYDITDPARPKQSATLDGDIVEFSPDGRLLAAGRQRNSTTPFTLSDVSYLTQPV